MSREFRVLIADDEAELREGIRSQLLARNFTSNEAIAEASDGAQAWAKIQSDNFDLVLLDVRMPAPNGLEVLKRIKQFNPSVTVAMLTAHANLKDAVQAIHDGAFDYIEKPLQPEKLDKLVERAMTARELVKELAISMPEALPPAPGFLADSSADFIGRAEPMQRIFRMIDRLAHVSTSVLIRGENGTGKELVAKAIHFNSPRKDKPFVAVNCGAMPDALVESELFGHEKGAFTGAHQRQIGKFQFASGGTLFLDEVGDLPLPMQVKLLRVLQEQRITPVGSNREVKVDVRIIAATNKNVEEAMKRGTFRQDLYYRLNVMPIDLPPLRKRIDDIPMLAAHFVGKFNLRHDRSVQGLSADALEALRRYDWPGNIRELENAIEHAFVIETGPVLQLASLPEPLLEALRDCDEGWVAPLPHADSESSPRSHFFALNYHQDKERFEKEFLMQALRTNNGRINQTCEKANIPKNTLLRKMRRYGLVARDFE